MMVAGIIVAAVGLVLSALNMLTIFLADNPDNMGWVFIRHVVCAIVIVVGVVLFLIGLVHALTA